MENVKADLIKQLERCCAAMERAAYIVDCETVEDLPEGIIESTGAITTLLIEVRDSRKLLNHINGLINSDEPREPEADGKFSLRQTDKLS